MRIRSWLAGTCLVPLVAAAAFAPSGRGGSEPPVSDIANGFVTDWVLLGPFATNQIEEALPAGTPRARFHRDFLTALGGESRAVLKAGQAVGYVNRAGGRREARAQRINPALDNPDCLDFRHILNDRHFLERDYDQAVAYAFCYLRSAQDQKVFAYLSSDGSPKVWVNGELVFQKWERGRKSRPPWQDGFALRLRKGVNPVLIKIDNDMNWWGFQFEVYDGAHHAGAIRNTVKSLAFRDVRAAEGRISALVDLVPAPLGIAEAPVRVEVESIDKRPIAARGGMTGRRIEVALPPGFSGPVNVRAVAAGGPFPALKPAAQFCYAGNFVSTLAELKRRFEAARGHASGYPSPWAPVYRGALDWIDRFFDSDFSTVDTWAVTTSIYVKDMTAALAAGRNFLADSGDKSFPVWFRTDRISGHPNSAAYLTRLPANYDANRKYPLLINLHGSSKTVKKLAFGDANVYYFDKLWKDAIIVSPAAPHPLVTGNGWHPEFLNELLADLKRRFRVDEDRIYLQGGSGGGKGTWNWVMANPEPFAAVSVLCGGEGYPNRAARLQNVPLAIFNGELDLASYPYMPERMASALKRAGAEVEYHLYPEQAHGVSGGIDKPAWMAWYLAHTHSARPAPPDPISEYGIGANGIGSMTIRDVPPASYLALTGREATPYPQDNIFRATMKLLQPYRRPKGLTPVRLADGTVFLRTLQGEKDGPMQAFLDAPDAKQAAEQSRDLELRPLPRLRAARVFLRADERSRAALEGRDSTWESFVQKRRLACESIEKLGYRRTGEERIRILGLEEPRIYELLIGVAGGKPAN